jgi:hypothetical protein
MGGSQTRILVNRFDFDEFVFVAADRFWADGEKHASLNDCHDGRALDYGTADAFEEIPRADFDAVVRALRDIEPYAAELRPIAEAIDAWVSGFCLHDRPTERHLNISCQSERLGQVLMEAYRCAADQYGDPELFSLFYYLDTHLPHLERPPVQLPISTETTRGEAVRYFQSKVDPFELVASYRGQYYFGTEVEEALHVDAYYELSRIGVRTLRRLAWEVRNAFQTCRCFTAAIQTLAKSDPAHFSISDQERDEDLFDFLHALTSHEDALDAFLEKVRAIRRHSLCLERALHRIGRRSQNDGLPVEPRIYEASG